MMHLTGNLLCSIDTETTGLVPGYHDLLQVAVIPLDWDVKPHKNIAPLEMWLTPKRPEHIDLEALKITKSELGAILTGGIESYKAADLFFEWFEKLNLGPKKHIVPLGCNYDQFDRLFIIDWLGLETYNAIFDSRVRDVQRAALYLNDHAYFQNEQLPFPKINLSYMAHLLKVKRERHNAMEDAITAAEVYRQMLKMQVLPLRNGTTFKSEDCLEAKDTPAPTMPTN